MKAIIKTVEDGDGFRLEIKMGHDGLDLYRLYKSYKSEEYVIDPDAGISCTEEATLEIFKVLKEYYDRLGKQ